MHPRAPSVAFLLFLIGDGLDKRADAAEDREDASALILKSSHDVGVTTASSLNFAAVEHSEREATVPVQISVGSIGTDWLKHTEEIR